MALNKKLAAMVGAAAMSLATPVEARAESGVESATEAAKVQEVKTSYMQSFGDWTWGAAGKGIDYLGQGMSYTGRGIGWGTDKVMTPFRWIGEKAKDAGEFLGRGPEWVEDKTGIPMQTAASILRAPGNFLHSVTDNASDLLTEAPDAAFGIAGSTLSMTGKTIEGDLSGAGAAGKELGSQSWKLTKTAVADGGVLALQGVGVVTGGVGFVPVDAIARDAVAGVRRTADLVTGDANLDKRISKDVFGAILGRDETVTSSQGVAQKAPAPQIPTPQRSATAPKDNQSQEQMNRLVAEKLRGSRRG